MGGLNGMPMVVPSSLLLLGCSVAPSATDHVASDTGDAPDAICRLDGRYTEEQDGVYVPSSATTTYVSYDLVYSEHCSMGGIDRFCLDIAGLPADACQTFGSFLSASGWLTGEATDLASGDARRVPASYPDDTLVYDVYSWSDTLPDDLTGYNDFTWSRGSVIVFDVASGAAVGSYRYLSGRDLKEVWCCEGQQVTWVQWGALVRLWIAQPEVIYTPSDFW